MTASRPDNLHVHGCCSSCGGTGIGGSAPETSGWCWDCRGTGHAHGPLPFRQRVRSFLRRGDTCWNTRAPW